MHTWLSVYTCIVILLHTRTFLQSAFAATCHLSCCTGWLEDLCWYEVTGSREIRTRTDGFVPSHWQFRSRIGYSTDYEKYPYFCQQVWCICQCVILCLCIHTAVAYPIWTCTMWHCIIYVLISLTLSMFVCDRFSYNMNMQQSIEYRSDKNSKHLSTIRIQSIAASLRQHGLGMIKCFHTKYIIEYQFMHVNAFVFL